MAYEAGSFEWQRGDAIGARRVSGDIVISNTKFTVQGTSDENTGDPSTWNGTQGKYAFFKSNDETLHEADYIVTFPYDESSVQDGKVIGRLPVAQVANKNDGTGYSDNEYAGAYGFMMSTATHMKGGQNTEFFTLYPIFSRIAFNITQSTTLDEVKVQSIILESQDGTPIFPTTLEVAADVKVAADGEHLDTSYMTPGEKKVSEIVLTTVEKKLNATTPQTWYMTLVPGTYDKFQVRINTNKGYFVKTFDGRTFNSGNATTANIDITSLTAYTEYVVASEIDWVQALGNINSYLSDNTGNPSIGNTSTIRVLGNVEYWGWKGRMDTLVRRSRGLSALKPGMVYDLYAMSEERERLTNLLRGMGYYYFQSDYIEILVDTTRVKGTADVRVALKTGVPELALMPCRVGEVSLVLSDDVQEKTRDSLHLHGVAVHAAAGKAQFLKDARKAPAGFGQMLEGHAVILHIGVFPGQARARKGGKKGAAYVPELLALRSFRHETQHGEGLHLFNDGIRSVPYRRELSAFQPVKQG